MQTKPSSTSNLTHFFSSINNMDSVPEWVGILVGERFFIPCSVHESAKKNDKTFFCFSCCQSICSHCLSSHAAHCLLQIRRYVYHDVIRLEDAEKLMNCSFVQPYTTNSAKVVFLKQRPMTRQFRESSNLCITCCRTLQHPYLFCSLSCKIHNQQATENSGIHQRQHEIKDYKHLPRKSKARISSLSNLQKTTTSVLEIDFSGGLTANVKTGVRFAISPAGKLVKKKRRCVNSVLFPARFFPVADIAAAVNRRKGVPHRSPFS